MKKKQKNYKWQYGKEQTQELRQLIIRSKKNE